MALMGLPEFNGKNSFDMNKKRFRILVNIAIDGYTAKNGSETEKEGYTSISFTRGLRSLHLFLAEEEP